MPHVSKKKLESEIFERLFIQLSEVFKIAGKRKTLSYFTDELFTQTEKIMFAKRLAAVLLLDREIPQHTISEKLNMSPSTIARLSLNVEIGKYKYILKIAGKNREDMFNILYNFILEKMPAPIGRGRWKRISMYRSSPEYDPEYSKFSRHRRYSK